VAARKAASSSTDCERPNLDAYDQFMKSRVTSAYVRYRRYQLLLCGSRRIPENARGT